MSGSLVDVVVGQPVDEDRLEGRILSSDAPDNIAIPGTPHPSGGRWSRLGAWVSRETSGGILLLIAAAAALIWANSPWRSQYAAISEFHLGPEVLHLNLSISHWAADGLLAIFFFVVGAELKNEMIVGSLRNIREAAVPVLAAVGGMVVPALIFTAVILVSGDTGALGGWAIPTATDIAFALAVLAIFGKGLPGALRMFLLTLAVVDDLLAIIVIAVFYSSGLNWWALIGSLVVAQIFGMVANSRWPKAWLLIPLALTSWTLMHASGVHATIAGVVLGLTLPALAVHGETRSRTHSFVDAIRPYSSGIALPVFAFFSAGVTVVGGEGQAGVLSQPVVLAVAGGLVLGKLVGVLGTTALVVKVTPLQLSTDITIRSLLPVGFLTGIGFTVSLLIAELSFTDPTYTAGAKIAVLIGTLTAAILAAIVLQLDVRRRGK